jgi:hypothetical protein
VSSSTEGVEVPVDDLAGPEIEVPDKLHRRVARPGPDGTMVEVLAARRGVSMRPGPVGGVGGSGDLNPVGIVIGVVIDLLVTVVTTAVVDGAAEGRPWKVKVYRMRRFPVQRLHSEVLPRGVEPEDRMRGLLDQFAPPAL